MLKLTHKAIARMAGYRLTYDGQGYFCYDMENNPNHNNYDWHVSAKDAYKACCVDNGLIEEYSTKTEFELCCEEYLHPAGWLKAKDF